MFGPGQMYYQQPAFDQFAQVPMLAFSSAEFPAGFVDDARFQTYYPNEVRHRKRTSRAQLQVLEAAFVDDQKPGPHVRRKISTQTGMTARCVQVWFQNRRAKAKNLAKKAAQAINQRNGDPKLDDDVHSEPDDDEVPADTPSAATPPASSPESSRSTSIPRSSPDLALRRGSAPAVVDNQHVPLGPPDAMRRQSLEMNVARMHAQPYRLPSRQPLPPSSFRTQLAVNTDRSRFPVAGWVNQTAAFVRAPAPQQLPGPLPAADFSFGAPPAPKDQAFADRSGRAPYDEPESPGADSYSRFGSFASVSDGDPARVPRFGSFASSDNDPTHGTRFSSFASVDSSASASTYYSLATPDGWASESRRSSCGEFTNMLAHMHVGTPAAAAGPTPELYKTPDVGAVHYETSPSSSDGSGGTLHYSPPPQDTARVAQADHQHRSELEFAFHVPPAPVKEAPRQRYTPPASYNHGGRKMSMPSSSLENAMGDSSLGMTSSSGGSASSSNSSLPLLGTPVDAPQPFSSPPLMVVGVDAAAYQQSIQPCYAPQAGYYGAPAVHVQPPSAGVGLGIDHAYPFFGA